MERIYIVQDNMSSPNHVIEIKQLDDVTQETTFKFKQETRKQIARTRVAAKRSIFAETLDFYGLKMCRESNIQAIKELVKSADEQFKHIDPVLYAEAIFVPLDMSDVQKGEFYEQVLDSIRYRVLRDIIEQLDIKSAQLPAKSKQAVEKLLNHLRSVNVLGDEGISKKLEEIQKKIDTEDLGVIKQELQKELDALVTRRGAYLEIE